MEQVANPLVDCVLIAGSNPYSNLPRRVMQQLQGVPVIWRDPFVNATSKAAHVTIGTALSGLECRGKALRMDGDEVNLYQAIVSDYPTDEEVLTYLLERVS